MKKIFGLVLLLIALQGTYAKRESRQGKIIYKYKKYERFDFSDISISGDRSSPGDLTINPRLQKKFQNKIPGRANFNPEIKRAVLSIR